VDQVAIGARTYGWYWSEMERYRLAYRGKSFVDLGCDVVEPGIVRIKKVVLVQQGSACCTQVFTGVSCWPIYRQCTGTQLSVVIGCNQPTTQIIALP